MLVLNTAAVGSMLYYYFSLWICELSIYNSSDHNNNGSELSVSIIHVSEEFIWGISA